MSPSGGRIGDRLGAQLTRRLQAMLEAVNFGCSYVHTPLVAGMLDHNQIQLAERDFFSGCSNATTSASGWRPEAGVEATGTISQAHDDKRLEHARLQALVRLRRASPLGTGRGLLARSAGTLAVAVHVRRGDLSTFGLGPAASRWTPDRYYLDVLPRVGATLANATGAAVHFHVLTEERGEWDAAEHEWAKALRGFPVRWHRGVHVKHTLAIMADADFFVPSSSAFSAVAQFYSLGVSLLPQERRAAGDMRLRQTFLEASTAQILPAADRCTCRSMDAVWRLHDPAALPRECGGVRICEDLARTIINRPPDEFAPAFGCALWCDLTRADVALDVASLRCLAEQTAHMKARLRAMARRQADGWTSVWELFSEAPPAGAFDEVLRLRRGMAKSCAPSPRAPAPTFEGRADDQPGRWNSQVGQDRAVATVLRGKRNGYFIDLAANDAVTLSNTRALERDFGWSGLCIEPNPRYHRDLKAIRSCRLLKAAVADTESDFRFRDAGGLGGIVSTATDNKPGEAGATFVRTVTFGKLLRRVGDVPRTIDYVSLDIEGAEELAMSTFPFHFHNITLLTVERPKPGLLSLLRARGLRFLCESGGFQDQLWADASVAAEWSGKAGLCDGVPHCEFLWWPGWRCRVEAAADRLLRHYTSWRVTRFLPQETPRKLRTRMSKPSFPTPITPSSTSFSPTKAQLRSSASGSALELLHRSRQRTHAAHAHDLQLLRQMVSVLVHKETVEGEPSDGLSGAGLVEEAQLYAVCMQELCSLVALNAPALAEISGALWRGFVGMFKRTLAKEERRVDDEKKRHRATASKLEAAEADARSWQRAAAELRRDLGAAQRTLEEREAKLAKVTKRHEQQETEARRLRALLEGQTRAERAATGGDGGGDDDEADDGEALAGRLISGAEDADATVAEAEELVEASGRIAHNLRRMVRTVGQVERAVQLRESSAQTDLVAGDDDAPTARDDGKARRRQQRRGALTPFQRVLASRSARRSTRSTLMPKRMLIRVIYQILTDKARSAPSETMPNYVYDYFLQMYGIKNLAERHLASFIASIKATADAAPRCALFAGLIGLSAVPMSADEADLVTSLYAALQKESFSAAAVAAKEQLEEMDDGRIWCCVPAALRAVAALFKQVDTVRPESYKRLTSAVEAQHRTDKRGRAVADVDEVVRAVAGTWAAERADFREQVSALFAAGDVNGDGVLSFGEFRAIMELVAPAVVHDELRILHAFRECLARADEADEAKREDERRRDRDGGDGDDDDDAEEQRGAKGEAAAKKKGGGGGGGGPERKGVRVEAVGIDSGVFVKVLEDLGLLGVRGAREMESARTSLLHQQREYQREHKEQQQQPGSPSRGRGDGGGSPNSPDALRRGGSSHGGSQSASPEGRRSGRGGEKSPAAAEVASAWQGARRRTVNLQMLQHSWSTNAAAMQQKVSEMLDTLAKMAPRRRGGGGPTEKDVLRRECEQLNQHLSQMQKLVGVDDDPEAAWQAFRDVSIKYDRISARLELLAEAAGAPAGADDVLIK